MRVVGRLGSVRRRSQGSNFYIVFCKTGSQNNRDLLGVWAEVGKVQSSMVTQGQELDWVPELSKPLLTPLGLAHGSRPAPGIAPRLGPSIIPAS